LRISKVSEHFGVNKNNKSSREQLEEAKDSNHLFAKLNQKDMKKEWKKIEIEFQVLLRKDVYQECLTNGYFLLLNLYQEVKDISKTL
jgi:hypothetical protein